MRHRQLLLLFDLAAVVAFVAIGRDTHDERGGVGGFLETAIPFLIALVVGWAATRAWRRPEPARTGVVVAVTTVALGMLLRNSWMGEGTAVSFIIVTTAFLGATMLGWRAALHELQRRRQAQRQA